MTCTPARLEANRKNALRSTGPRTAEGKERSRGNALKHGLTGAGVILPEIDVPAVAALEANLTDELRPTSTIGGLMVRRMAVLAVRLQRCEQHDAAMTARRVREAEANYDAERRAEVRAALDAIWADPDDAVQRLYRTSDGIEALLDEWHTLRAMLTSGETWNRRGRSPHEIFSTLSGQRPGEFHDREITTSGEILVADSDSERQAEARRKLIARIDRQIDALEDLRYKVANAAELADRNEAGVRALIDSSPESVLARKYEAATERGFFRALREFHKAEADAAAAAEDEPTAADEAAPAPAPATLRLPQTNPSPAAPEPDSDGQETTRDPAGVVLVAATGVANPPLPLARTGS